MLASCPAHKVNQITAEPRKNESASRHPALESNPIAVARLDLLILKLGEHHFRPGEAAWAEVYSKPTASAGPCCVPPVFVIA